MSTAWGCDATLYRSTRAADSNTLLVGDAASFIEPLSSAGVKKALASAWRAAVVVNTVIASPELLDAASAFHDRRERQVYAQCVRRSAAFFKSASAVYADLFGPCVRTIPPMARKPTKGRPTEQSSATQPSSDSWTTCVPPAR